MDGEQQHRASTPNHKLKRKRNKKAKGGNKANSVGSTGSKVDKTSGEVSTEQNAKQQGRSSRVTAAFSRQQGQQRQQQQQQQPVNSVEATDENPGAKGRSGVGGIGEEGDGKRSRKRRRKGAAAAAAAAAAGAAASPPPSPPDGVTMSSASSRSSGSSRGAKKAKLAKHASRCFPVNKGDKTPEGAGHRDRVPSVAAPAGATSREPSGGGGGGRTDGDGTAAAAGSEGSGRSGAPRLSELQKRMRQKLEGAQFRMINETLYTLESGVSLAKFKREPELFDVYHRGFREQVEKWPVHPLDIIIDWLRKYPKATVADFGCGEARLAATVPNKVHSFDLVSPNPLVTACDMASVPIEDASVHVAVFCLSLMGTNLADFLREAHRVLIPGGLVKVAEVRSRFEGEEGGVERFLEVTRRLGFDTRKMDRSNKMFLMAEFKKSNRKPESGVHFEAKACIYKRR